MPVSVNEIYALSIALFERAPTEGELAQWQGLPSLTAVTAALLAADDRYAGLTGGDLVAAAVATLARDNGVDTPNIAPARQQVTIDYFTTELAKDGVTQADVLVLMTQALMRATDGQWQIARDVITQDVAEAMGDAAPANPGEERDLTAKADQFVGTEGDDQFIAFPEPADLGMIANSLQTGDRLDGGAGNDTLEATIQTDYTVGGAARSIKPITQNIEKVFLDADAEDRASTGGDNVQTAHELRVNADDMANIEEIWSRGSEQSLRVENLHVSSNAPNTEDVAIGMRDTGNRGSENDRDEADYEVYFDERDLIAGQAAGQEGLVFQMLDQTAYDNGDNPLTDFALDKISFVVDGTLYALSFDNPIEDTPETYEGLVSALNALLSAQYPALAQEGLKFGLGGDFTDPDNRVGTDITLTIPDDDEANQRLAFPNNATPYTAVEFGSSASNNIYRQAAALDPEAPTGLPVTASVILDGVGRGSDGGYLRVGSMSEGPANAGGIEVYDIQVQHDSSLSGLYTTNGTLNTVRIASDAGFTGDLAIGNQWTTTNNVNDGNGLNGGAADNANNVEDGVSEHNIQLIDATGFMGDLSLGTTASRFQEVKTLNANINGDVDFYANIENDNVATTYTTGAGNDIVDVTLDTDAIDAIGAALDINTGSGNDIIVLRGDVDGDASQQTMADLNAVALNSGAGNDVIQVDGDVRADITAGAGSDFIKLSSSDGFTGEWTIGRASASDPITDTLPHLADRVLYKAQLTVTFAGFESTVTVDTDAAGHYIATQEDINTAIEAAIAQNPELVRLLNVTKGDGDQQIRITSNVDGENDLGINLVQPTVVASGTAATAGQVSLASGDFTALAQGLINTGVVADSSTVDTEAGVVTTMDSIDGVLNETGAVGAVGTDTYFNFNAGGSQDATGTVNYSVVNAGAGSNDLVALNSNDNSANVLEVDQTFGKVSVVNFHNDSPNDVTDANQVGNHAIDFTAFLDNDIDPSNNGSNSQSVRDVAVTLNIRNPHLVGSPSGSAVNIQEALANSVNMLGFNEASTPNGGSFADLTAAKLVAALNGTDATTNTGGLTGTTLDAATSTTDLVGNVQKHIVMVENDDSEGEYKVFSLTSTVDATTGSTDGEFDTASATLLGTLDFGASINFNLVGSQAWKDLIEGTGGSAGLYAQADGAEPTTPTPDTDYTVQGYKDEDPQPTSGYTITDTLESLVSEANLVSGSAILANATGINAILAAGQTVAVDLIGLSDTTHATAIDFTDDAATLSMTEVNGLTHLGLDLTTADAITITGAAAADINTLSRVIGFNGTDAASADVIEVNDGETVRLPAAQLNAMNTGFVSLAAQHDGTGTDATVTVNMLDGKTVTVTGLKDTFQFVTSDSGVTINDFTSADDTVALGGSNAAVARNIASLDGNETLVFDTSANLGVNGALIGDQSGGSTVHWAVASDTGQVYYDADGDWTAASTLVGVVNADALVATDFTVG